MKDKIKFLLEYARDPEAAYKIIDSQPDLVREIESKDLTYAQFAETLKADTKVLQIRFTHGREDPEMDMESFGYEGRRVIIEAFQYTYGTNLQILDEHGDRYFLDHVDGLIKLRYEGEIHYFGDFFVGMYEINWNTLTFDEFVSTQEV